MLKTIHNKYFYSGLSVFVLIVLAIFALPHLMPAKIMGELPSNQAATSGPIIVSPGVVSHKPTPPAVKAIYMSACVAATPSFRTKLIKLANETEINSIVLDIKDFSGTISFDVDLAGFPKNDAGGCQVSDMKEFIETLHAQDIYVIGRITSFQDSYVSKIRPEWAVKTKTDTSVVWKDRKGISFIDAGNQDMWKYLGDLAQASYDIGFDEINFDYIRFPSDGNMEDIYFPFSVGRPKHEVLKGFFEYLHNRFSGTGVVTSADLFGMTTTNYDDLNIGQILEDAAPNFDYIAPMVYPSHYPSGFLGYKDVNKYPYEIIKYSMDKAAARLTAIGISPLKLRPWLQDNDYPVVYTPEMVRAQIQATYDAGLTSWMLWDAGNTYTQAALKTE